MVLQDSLDPTTVALLIGFGVLILALVKKPPARSLYTFYAGLVWLTVGLTIFPEYGAEWVIMIVGLGLLILFEGALELMEVIN